ncbi:MAG: branched-chain amino acid ABC transporter permease [Anaerolineae bacterium]|nr:branched-chain amino acid ABC transporter permease [Anaerolineae bacterium]
MDQFIRAYGDVIVAMFFWAILALSLYLPLMAGQLSLASPGFYAVGGYVAAILSTKVFPLPATGELIPIWQVLIEMGAAAVVCAGLAIIVGIPALRLRGIYLALATIALVEVLRIVSQTLEITGGAVGIFGIPQPFDTRIQYLLLVVPMLLIVMFFVARLERSRVGRAFVALREDELAASAMGINPTRYKVLAFTLGAVLAGIVGAVSAHFLNTWNPRQGTFDAGILILAYVLIGGSRTYLGPVVGGMVLTALPEALRQLSSIQGLPTWAVEFLLNGRLIIFGLLIALSTRFFPQGLITPTLFSRKEAAK